ncbi:MAG: translocation/assembly module TamB domain-containing protein [marine benthic group bacterium]|nr:translocation/assembly module TamB domain-containing protein [Gemmatimonadota bacterium]
MPRWLRWTGIGLLGLALVLVGIGAYLVGTTPGGRTVLSLAEGFLPDDLAVEVDSFEGRLIDRFSLEGVHVDHPAVEADVDRVELDWRGLGIIRRKAHIRSLVIDGAEIRLKEPPSGADSVEVEPEPDAEPGPPLANLPVALSFDSVVVRGVQVTTADSIRVSDARLRLSGPGRGSDGAARSATPGSLESYALDATARIDAPDLTTADVMISGAGSNVEFRLDTLSVSALDGHTAASGELAWWPAITWDLTIAADSLAPAPLLPEPDEWPGRISLRGQSAGGMSEEGTIELDAAIDTIYGQLRGESLDGRFAARVAGPEIELSAARIAWGPARVEVSGQAGETLDLAFDAEVPDLGLLLPGASGSLTADGRASGPRDTPRISANLRAEEIVTDAASASSVSGDVDVDLAGPLQAELLALGVGVAGRDLDSVRVGLTGRRADHQLRISASGPRAELALEASGGLDEAGRWAGTLDTLALRADTIGAWALEAPAALAVGPGVEFEELCLRSDPARICAGGASDDTGLRLDASIDSLRLERFAPLMPEGYEVEAGIDAVIDLDQEAQGPVKGTIDLRTTAGSLALPRSDEGGRLLLRFEPIVFALTSADSGSVGEVDLVLTDSAGAALVRVEGEIDSPFALYQPQDLSALDSQPFSARAELAVDDLELFSAYALPRWDAWGSMHALVELEVDEAGALTGTLAAATDSMRLRNTVRQEAYLLTLDPFRLDARVGPDGLTGETDLAVSVPGSEDLITVRGEIRMPELTSLEIVPAEQPVDATLSIQVDDLYVIEAFLPEVSDVKGRFSLDSRIGGTLGELEVDGTANVADGYALIPLLGLELRDIRFDAVSAADGEIRLDGQVTSGEGTLTLSGVSENYPSSEEPSTFQIRGENFRVMDTPEIRVAASPSLDVAFDGTKLRLAGDVTVPSALIGIPDLPESAVTPSDDVIIVGDTTSERSAPVPLEVDITLTLGDDVYFDGFGLDAQLLGGLNITQAPGADPRGRGEIRMVNGTFRQLGQELRIDPGRLIFNGPVDDPAIDARAFVRATDGTEAGFRVGGTVQNLALETYSNPPRTESDIMSYILFGRPMSQTSGTEGNQASNAAALLGANMLAMSLAPSIGLDEARVETGTQQNKAQLVVGKYLSPKLYVGYGIGLYEPISTLRLRYLLTSRWSIEAITGDQQSTDLLWRIERGGPADEPAADEPAEVDEPVESEQLDIGDSPEAPEDDATANPQR